MLNFLGKILGNNRAERTYRIEETKSTVHLVRSLCPFYKHTGTPEYSFQQHDKALQRIHFTVKPGVFKLRMCVDLGSSHNMELLLIRVYGYLLFDVTLIYEHARMNSSK